MCENFILHPTWIETKRSKKRYFKNFKYDLLASLSQVYETWQYISALSTDCESQVFRDYSQSLIWCSKMSPNQEVGSGRNPQLTLKC